jgi:hypothetical protein
MINWLAEYQDDIAALEQVGYDVALAMFGDLTDDEHLKLVLEDVKEIFAALRDGNMETAFELWWQKFKESEITAAKREATIIRCLAPLFEKLAQASDAEWEEFAHIRMRARLDSPLMRLMLQRLNRLDAAWESNSAV